MVDSSQPHDDARTRAARRDRPCPQAGRQRGRGCSAGRSSSGAGRIAGLAAALFALFQPHAAAAAASVASHCTAHERTLFACRTGTKLLSVCASANLGKDSGFVQYRFGTPGHTELVLPMAGTDWRAAIRAGSLMFSGGGGAYLAFANPPYRYVVYTAFGRGWGNKEGVVVERRGRRIASRPCTGEATSVLGPELFEGAAIVEDTSGFELP